MRIRAGVALLVACVAAEPVVAQRGAMGGGRSAGPRPLLFGFALECVGCGTARGNGRGPMAAWHYSDYPRVVDIAEGGSADRAGIRKNDLVLSVDGFSLLSDEGARRFAAVKLGDDVRLMIERDAQPHEVMLTLGPVGRLGGGGGFRGGLATAGRGFGELGLRGGGGGRGRIGRGFSDPASIEIPAYSGRAGNTRVDVWGDTPVSASTDSTGALVLRIGATTVRLRPEASPKKP